MSKGNAPWRKTRQGTRCGCHVKVLGVPGEPQVPRMRCQWPIGHDNDGSHVFAFHGATLRYIGDDGELQTVKVVWTGHKRTVKFPGVV